MLLLPHQSLLKAQLRAALAEVNATLSSRGLLFIGPSGSGKTYLFKLLAQEMPPFLIGNQRQVPFCWVSLRSTSDPSTILRRILAALGKPESATAGLKLGHLESQVMDAMDSCGVVVLAIEEFHNALLKTEKKFRGQSNGLLKSLWNADDHNGRVILISGTNELIDAFDADDELNSRFSTRIHAVSLWFDSPEGIRHFRGVADSIAARHGVQTKADTRDSLFLARLLFACRGHLRRLDSLCARVATLLRDGLADDMPLVTWASAFDQVLAKYEGSENPFRLSEEDFRRRLRAETKRPNR